MSHTIRFQRREAVYLVTNRCILNFCFFRPSKVVNQIIEETLVWAAAKHQVLMYEYSFRPSDFWMVMGAPKLNRQDFMRDFQSRVAAKLNKHWGRRGKFFAGRYKCSHLLDNFAAWKKVCKVLCAPCAVDLVDHPSRWTGVSSYDLRRTGARLEVERENRTKFWRLKQQHPLMSDEEATRLATETHCLELSELDLPELTSRQEYRMELLAAINEEAKRLSESRQRHCLGMGRVTQLRAMGPPGYPVPESPPTASASSGRARREFRINQLARRDRYHSARDALRRGRTDIRFPGGTIPLHKCSTVPETSRDVAPREETQESPTEFGWDDWEKCG